MLTGCPNTGLLATSRERLGVPGEQTYRLAPLGTVDEGVELFEQRSREQDASFRLDAADRAVVERICVLLDAMPLAIELAAARTTVLTPSEILDGLERRLTSLRSRSEALSPRQRSLDALLDWSYELSEPRRAGGPPPAVGLRRRVRPRHRGARRRLGRAYRATTFPSSCGRSSRSRWPS